ncbi:MAG: lysylphosphatidylglycerol synthase transmembrane domain-containing protein [Thermomicrobiales bacterium]
MTHPRQTLFGFIRTYGPYLWLAAVLGLAIYFGIRQQAELGRIRDALGNSHPGWIAGLVGIELVILILVARTYRVLLDRLGHRLRILSLIRVHLQRVVVGTVTPVGGPSSMVVFVHSLRKKNVRAADALLAISIKSVIGNVAFLMILIPVLFVQKPSTLLVFSTIGLVMLVAVMVGALAVGLSNRKPPRWLLSRLPRKGLKFLAEVRCHHISFRSLIEPFSCMLATKLCGALMLFVALHAVGQDPNISVPLIAYVIGMVFFLVAPVFQGIGIVEVSMAVALERLGIPASAAVAATLLCRMGELWLPLSVGILMQARDTLVTRSATGAI